MDKKDNKKKAKNRQEDIKSFVEKVDQMKKVNPKDLSSDQDLTIAIMNLISIEEHLMFSGAKTEKTGFYDLIEEIREMRKALMFKVIPDYEGEVWCISKHLLASSMRLMEVGTKQLSMKNTKDAYDLFDKSYELYCMFWGLNLNIINLDDVKWAKETNIDVGEVKKHVENMKSNLSSTIKTSEKKESTGIMAKLKKTIKSAVNCCIE